MGSKRGKKKACIVVVKKDDLLQAMIQALVGCELQAIDEMAEVNMSEVKKDVWCGVFGAQPSVFPVIVPLNARRFRLRQKLCHDELIGTNFDPVRGGIHVLGRFPEVIHTSNLVTEPDEIKYPLKESDNLDHAKELKYYKDQGQLIQQGCPDSSNEILDKIETLERHRGDSLPFICVQGSSGMGKSQLVFALNG
ncbi:hypothetical protein THRCLA_23417 [Thraustotheca clavata]|uniref:Crinkler (CRN) family protein n=1 Tax=Thraustotheca clavata TaxID=74557 RepID=A0A1V9Y5W2_9STRA|nr:hypothetical protein THRCLA_23417 [Thraustotheca clavata]